VGPNLVCTFDLLSVRTFQSSVRINVGPNGAIVALSLAVIEFQSSVRINVGPNSHASLSSLQRGQSFNPP